MVEAGNRVLPVDEPIQTIVGVVWKALKLRPLHHRIGSMGRTGRNVKRPSPDPPQP
jgi:hypothetical protein